MGFLKLFPRSSDTTPSTGSCRWTTTDRFTSCLGTTRLREAPHCTLIPHSLTSSNSLWPPVSITTTRRSTWRPGVSRWLHHQAQHWDLQLFLCRDLGTTCQSTAEFSTSDTLVSPRYKHSSRILPNLPSAADPVSPTLLLPVNRLETRSPVNNLRISD